MVHSAPLSKLTAAGCSLSRCRSGGGPSQPLPREELSESLLSLFSLLEPVEAGAGGGEQAVASVAGALWTGRISALISLRPLFLRWPLLACRRGCAGGPVALLSADSN